MHSYNPSYSGDNEALYMRPAWAKLARTYLKNKKKALGV
jgi:hypothetical protein